MEKSSYSPGIFVFAVLHPTEKFGSDAAPRHEIMGLHCISQKETWIESVPCPQSVQLVLGKMYGESNVEKLGVDLVLDQAPFENFLLSFILNL